MPGAIIIGVGPGIGLSVARRFARGGMPVSVIARTRGAIDAAAETLRRDGARVTGCSPTALTRTHCARRSRRPKTGTAYRTCSSTTRRWSVVTGWASSPPCSCSAPVNVGGAVTAAARAGRKMAAAGHGTLIITGGMPEPLPESFSLSLGKAGVRTLVELLDQELGPSGVHVTTVTVYGGVAPGTAFDPDDIAETYWQLYRQPREEWTREVAYTGPAAIPRSAAGKSPS